MAIRRSVMLRPCLSSRRELSTRGISATLIWSLGFEARRKDSEAGLQLRRAADQAFPFQTGGVTVSRQTLGRIAPAPSLSPWQSFRPQRSETMLTVIDSAEREKMS